MSSSSNTATDSRVEGLMHVKSVGAQSPSLAWCGSFERACQLRCPACYLIEAQNYEKGKNAVQARKKLTDVYGEGVMTVRQCQNWFAKFRSGNFDVKNAPRSGRPVEADKVYDHLKGLGLSSKLDVWVPYVLTERNLCRCIDVYDSLLKHHENDPFLKGIITGDEKSHGAKKMTQIKPFPKPIFTKKRVGKVRRLSEKRTVINRKSPIPGLPCVKDR
ncbi:mariner transposase [Trichonephila clavipes]|nr:mariner transposase [Trichonephila clavipes]